MLHRTAYFIGFLVVALLLGIAAYLEINLGINPCPLCMLQRVMTGALGIVFLIGMACSQKNSCRIIAGGLSVFFSLLGILLSGRQVWLQYMPTQMNENCEVSLQYMLSALPLDEAIAKIFTGGATCSKIDWEFLHVSLAQWSLVWFILFLIFSVWQLRKRSKTL